MKTHLYFSLAAVFAILTGCMKWDYYEEEDLNSSSSGLFILNEGNFQYSNATLSFYDPLNNIVENEVFYRANGMRLGDVAQSMTVFDNKGWIVVNNSHVVFAIDLKNFRELGRIENLTSPRYIHFINEEKAYVTQLWDNRIFIVNPKTYTIAGYIEIPDMNSGNGSTEQMVQIGKYVYCNCWSYQNRIIKIDTETDKVIDQVIVGIQPYSLVADCNNKIWTITDGGYEGSPFGYESPALFKIDPEEMIIEKRFDFKLGDITGNLAINGTKDTIYWVNKDIWKMSVNAEKKPDKCFIPYRNTRYYNLTVNPQNSELYVADAIDFMQQGIIYRFSPAGDLIDEFYTGVTPGAFCWK